MGKKVSSRDQKRNKLTGGGAGEKRGYCYLLGAKPRLKN